MASEILIGKWQAPKNRWMLQDVCCISGAIVLPGSAPVSAKVLVTAYHFLFCVRFSLHLTSLLFPLPD